VSTSQTLFKIYFLVHPRSFPLTLVASLAEPETLQPSEPSIERREFFESTTGMPYVPPTNVQLSDTITVRCPCCVSPTQHHVPWWNSEGTGYAQPGFKVSCAECHKTFKKRLWGLEGSVVRLLSVALAVSFHSRSSCPIQICSVSYQTLRETLLDPYTGKVDETMSEQYIKLMLVVSLTKPMIFN